MDAIKFSELAGGDGALMAVVYAFLDESGKWQNHDAIVLAGLVGHYDTFERFGRQWRRCLRRAKLECFSMKEALAAHKPWGCRPAESIDERIEGIKPFAECVRDFPEERLALALDVPAFNALKKRARYLLGGVDNPQYVAFLRAMGEVFPLLEDHESLSLVCDDEEEIALGLYGLYRRIKKIHPQGARLASLAFADDEKFPPLQGADLIASLARLESGRVFQQKPYDYEGLTSYVMYDGPTMLGGFYDSAMMEHLAAKLEAMKPTEPSAPAAADV